MKVGILALILLVAVLLFQTSEGFKNVDFDAQNQIAKINQKILPKNALCIRGAQCISGKCLDNNNETTYGYCQ
jgi:hypothetical protein